MTRTQFLEDLVHIGAIVSPRLVKQSTITEKVTLPNGKYITLISESDSPSRVMLHSIGFYASVDKLVGCETDMGNNPLVYEYDNDCYLSIDWQ